MDGTITTTPPPASVTDADENEYLPDAWGRFTLPGPLAASLLASGGWHYWTEADAPALGEWVDMGLPTLAEADEGELFPCFVNLHDLDPSSAPVGLRYRTVGATQVQIGGTAVYCVGTNIPTDYGTPSSYTTICPMPSTFTIDPTDISLSSQGFNPSSGVPALAQAAPINGNLAIVGPDDEAAPLLPGIAVIAVVDASAPAG